MSEWLDHILSTGSVPCSASSACEKRQAQACVLISVVHTRGSCPRDTGTRMVVEPDFCFGTIGGGHLEYQAIGIAHELLSSAIPHFHIERFPLGARVGQCCGGLVLLSFEVIPADRPPWVAALRDVCRAGQSAILVTSVDDKSQGDENVSLSRAQDSCTQDDERQHNQGHTDAVHKLVVTQQTCIGVLVDSRDHQLAVFRARELLSNSTTNGSVQESGLLYERIDTPTLHIAIFGAGHVGKALVSVLSNIPCRIVWIDSRSDEFPVEIAHNVQVEVAEQPEFEIDDLPKGAHVLVMTHSHALDLAICERALRRDDLAWCGLIGSDAKCRRFEKRLLMRGLPETVLKNLTCPIGIDGITGKHPAEIAISVAAQVLASAQALQCMTVSEYQAA